MTARTASRSSCPARFPEPARQRRRRHRGRHGDQHPAAQCRRIVRGAAASDRATRPARPPISSPMSPAPISRPAGSSSSRAASIAEAYATGRGSFRLRARWTEGAAGPRALPDRRHRDPLSGAEGAADREDRGAARREKAAAARRYPRRIDRGGPPRPRTEDPQCRCRRVDGAAVPADRAGSPGAAQPQCHRSRRGAAGDEFEGGAAGLSRPPPRGVAAPQPAPPRRGRAPHGGAARLCHRLRQPRRGDPHHPRGGRPEGRDDGALGPQRGTGRGDPQHAAAHAAPARRDRDPEGTEGLADEAAGLEALLASDRRQWRALAKEVAATAGRIRRRHAVRPPPHPHRQRAGARSRSPRRRWSSARR